MTNPEISTQNPETSSQTAAFMTDMYRLSKKGKEEKTTKDYRANATFHLKDGRMLSTYYVKSAGLVITQACVWDIMRFGSAIAFPAEIFTAVAEISGGKKKLITAIPKYDVDINYDMFGDDEEKNARSHKLVQAFSDDWKKRFEEGEGKTDVRTLINEAKRLQSFGPIDWFFPNTEVSQTPNGEFKISVDTVVYDLPEKLDPEETRAVRLEEFMHGVQNLTESGIPESIQDGVRTSAGYDLDDGRMLIVVYWTDDKIITAQASIIDFSIEENCLLMPMEHYSVVYFKETNGDTTTIHSVNRDIHVQKDLIWQTIPEPQEDLEIPQVAIKVKQELDATDFNDSRENIVELLFAVNPDYADRIFPSSNFIIDHNYQRLRELQQSLLTD